MYLIKKLLHSMNDYIKHVTSVKYCPTVRGFINILDNRLFKYFRDFCKMYTCTGYYVSCNFYITYTF